MKTAKLVAAVAALSIAGVVGANFPTVWSPAFGSDVCRDMSRDCMIAVAETYINAQAGGPGTREDMRLAPAALRWENGVMTGTSGDDIRSKSGFGLDPRYVQRLPRRFWVAKPDNEVFARWTIDIWDDTHTTNTSTVHIFERIHVEKGVCGSGPSPCVTEVEAIFCISPHPQEPELPSTVVPGESALCLRVS
jgi:hypothetical protein